MTGVYQPTVGRGPVRRRADHRPQAAPDQPDGHRPHVPEHPAVPGDDRAGERAWSAPTPGTRPAWSARCSGSTGSGQAGGAAAGHRDDGLVRAVQQLRRRRRRSSASPGTPWRSGRASASRSSCCASSASPTGPTTLARNLPYGYQRRLEIARALATEPKLLCLDEPAAGFNPAEKEELLQLIRQDPRPGLHGAAHRARHAAGHGRDRPDRGAGVRQEDRRGLARPRSRDNPKVIAAYLGVPADAA